MKLPGIGLMERGPWNRVGELRGSKNILSDFFCKICLIHEFFGGLPPIIGTNESDQFSVMLSHQSHRFGKIAVI